MDGARGTRERPRARAAATGTARPPYTSPPPSCTAQGTAPCTAPHAHRACTGRHASSTPPSASPQELPRLHGYVDETLALKPTLKDNLRKLTPAQFERVLHPVFEEDELTLVIVGAVLGGAVGWAQAWWDARSKRLDAESRGTPPPGLAP